MQLLQDPLSLVGTFAIAASIRRHCTPCVEDGPQGTTCLLPEYVCGREGGLGDCGFQAQELDRQADCRTGNHTWWPTWSPQPRCLLPMPLLCNEMGSGCHGLLVSSPLPPLPRPLLGPPRL